MGFLSSSDPGHGQIMDWLIAYILAGIAFTEAIEMANRHLKKLKLNYNRLGVGSYIGMMLLWPIFLLIFLRGLFR